MWYLVGIALAVIVIVAILALARLITRWFADR